MPEANAAPAKTKLVKKTTWAQRWRRLQTLAACEASIDHDWMAASHAGDSGVLSGERYDEVWRIFEGHAKSGLSLIAGWRQENPTDVSGLETLLEKINTKARALLHEDGSKKDIDIKF